MINIKTTATYLSLDSWILSNIIQLSTFSFCRKFLNAGNDPCGRMFDQMTQAARSIQANIAEGMSRGSTSNESKMKLLDVARASASELSSDYMFILMLRNETRWHKTSPQWLEVYNLRLDAPNYADDFVHDAMAHIISQKQKFDKWLLDSNVSIAANANLILCGRVISMITKLIEKCHEEFCKNGGFTENLTKDRVEYRQQRAQAEGAPTCPKCGAPMIKKIIKRGVRNGQSFWGCSNYPKCEGTRN